MSHIPVLLKETIEILDPRPGEFFIDGTLGNGGHAKEIIKRIEPNGIFLGIDWDRSAIQFVESGITNRELGNLTLVCDNFANVAKILRQKKLAKAHGLLLDLGLSSEQLEKSGRGFSFQKDEPLLMTYNHTQKPAYQWLRDMDREKLAGVVREFGEERYAGRIARAIKENLPIKNSRELAEVIRKVLPKNYERGRIHPATRTFLALRIFVNHELENLAKTLEQLADIIKSGGRVAIISFNSLEDRLVKHYFRNLVRARQALILTKKPITPITAEIRNNPRARSAKLRALKII